MRPESVKEIEAYLKTIRSDDPDEEFLSLAGFADPGDIWVESRKEMLKDWKAAKKRLRLTDEDVRYATREWIPMNFEIQLEGVRKTIGMMTAEIVDLMKASDKKAAGEKMVYGVIPAHSNFYYAMKKTNPKVNTYFCDANLASFLNPFFHKIAPFLEDAENHGITYGCRHCALNKTRYSLLRQGIVPKPNISWIWGFVCDQSPQSDEFIKEYWDQSYNIHWSRVPHDTVAHSREYEDKERVEYVGSVVREGYEACCKALEIDVDENALKEATKERIQYVMRYGKLAQLMASDPVPIGGTITLFLTFPTFMAFNTMYEYGEPALRALIDDAKERAKEGRGVVPAGAPKTMAWFIPYNNPFVTRMFEDNDVALAYCDGLLPAKCEMEMPKFTGAFEGAAEALLKWNQLCNWGMRADLAVEKIETYNIDAMIWGFLDFDRWLGSDHKMCSRIVEKETGKPSFYIEGDIWEDRDYSMESMRTRIETICEIIKARMALSA